MTRTHGCLCKIIFSAIFAIATTIPTFATNISDSNKGCTSGNLTTSSGTAALEADWAANTVTVTYYNGENVYGNGGQCTYDSTLTLPSAPSKNGYTFAGWKVKTVVAPQCISNNFASWTAEDIGYKSEYINKWYPQYTNNTEKYSLLDDNTWAVEFEEGTVQGISVCGESGYPYAYCGEDGGYPDLEEDLTEENSVYFDNEETADIVSSVAVNNWWGYNEICYCKVTKFNGNTVVASDWASLSGFDNADNEAPEACGSYCAVLCARFIKETGFRTAIFNATNFGSSVCSSN